MEDVRVEAQKTQISDLAGNEKKGKRQYRFRGLFMTINTNKVYYDPFSDELKQDAEKLAKALDDFFAVSNLKHYLFRADKKEMEPGDIKEIKVIPVVERGSEKGKLHAHVRLTMRASTPIKLLYARVPDFFQDALGLDYRPHFFAKPFRSDIEQIDDYLKKNFS
jgi:hypothetical protein